MVDVKKLKGALASNDISQTDMACKLGITQKTFSTRMQQKRFYTDEIDIMVEVLNLDHDTAVSIFFAQKVSC